MKIYCLAMIEKKENPKREYLRRLSVKAREIKEQNIQEAESPEDAFLWEEMRINDIIIKEFYCKDGNVEFHLYKQWKELGYQVKKGSKAFVIWGRKRKGQKPIENEKGEKDEFKFYPLAYLFSNNQVEKAPD